MATKIVTYSADSRNQNETLTPTIKVYDSSGNLSDSGNMSHIATGKYSFDFTATVGTDYFAEIIIE